MTPKSKETIRTMLGIPAAVVSGGIVVYWLLSTGFVTRPEYNARKASVDSTLASYRGDHCYIRYMAKVEGYTLERCALQDGGK